MSLTDEMMKQFGVDALTKPMTKGEAYQLLDALKSVLLEHKGRLDALEASGIKYCGTWQRPYRKGMVVTSAGSMWTALDTVPEGVQPGSNTAYWARLRGPRRDTAFGPSRTSDFAFVSAPKAHR
jgi:hypothetical protein